MERRHVDMDMETFKLRCLFFCMLTLFVRVERTVGRSISIFAVVAIVASVSVFLLSLSHVDSLNVACFAGFCFCSCLFCLCCFCCSLLFLLLLLVVLLVLNFNQLKQMSELFHWLYTFRPCSCVHWPVPFILGSGNVTAISVVTVFEEVCTGIRVGLSVKRITAKAFAKDVLIDQGRRLGD